MSHYYNGNSKNLIFYNNSLSPSPCKPPSRGRQDLSHSTLQRSREDKETFMPTPFNCDRVVEFSRIFLSNSTHMNRASQGSFVYSKISACIAVER
jgi:hypothetical protein